MSRSRKAKGDRSERSERSDRGDPSIKWRRAADGRLDAHELRRPRVFAEQLVTLIHDRGAINEQTAKRVASVAIATMRRPLSRTEQALADRWHDVEQRVEALLKVLGDRPPDARFSQERLQRQLEALRRVAVEASIAGAAFRSWWPSDSDGRLVPKRYRQALRLRLDPVGSGEPSLRDQFVWLAFRAIEADRGPLAKGERIAFLTAIAGALGISQANANTIKRDLVAMRGSDLRLRIERLVVGADSEGRPRHEDVLTVLDQWYAAFVEWRAHVSLVG